MIATFVKYMEAAYMSAGIPNTCRLRPVITILTSETHQLYSWYDSNHWARPNSRITHLMR